MDGFGPLLGQNYKKSSHNEGHDKKVVDLLAELQTKKDFFMTQLDWSTGIVIMTKK